MQIKIYDLAHRIGGSDILNRTEELTPTLLKRIARYNGSPIERVEKWLKNGQTVFTNFKRYVPVREE